MAPIGDEDWEALAKDQLLKIHPSVRSQISVKIGAAWMTMTMVERVETCEAMMPQVEEDGARDEEWQTFLKYQEENPNGLLSGEPAVLDMPEEEVAEDAGDMPKFWAASGRCPYGMDKGKWVIGPEELAQHNIKQSCWMAIEGQVYDATPFLKKHPGGAEKILEYGGRDATEGFNSRNHSSYAKQQLERLLIGRYDNPEEKAKEELMKIHPNIRMKVVESLESLERQAWLELSFVEKLRTCKEKMKLPEFAELVPAWQRDGNDVQADEGDLAEGSCPYGFDGNDDQGVADENTEPGKCPYGFDRENEEAGAEGAPEVCPVSGKKGQCPMQAMHKQQAQTGKTGSEQPNAPRTEKKKVKKQPSAPHKETAKEDCVIA